ncbi:hypothetical protein JOL79_06915 [Microbispora sp. RL4-1S]|uniref:Uncharacterized protein n=1 Tax=Microbispora oryzae TaxID=2806554 RepID=A0A941APB5_9ACTN|nr:hypothetical protein [Microbispora oryzae]MBP2703529.1 hypothetical protein [Microbispora oryzae]
MKIGPPLIAPELDEWVLSAAENYHLANLHAANAEAAIAKIEQAEIEQDRGADWETLATLRLWAGMLRAQLATAGGVGLTAPEGASRQAVNMRDAEALRVMAAHPGDTQSMDYSRGRQA